MKNVTFFVAVGLSLLNTAAFADGKYICVMPQAGDFTETLTITGSGQGAVVHVEDPTLIGDCTYDAEATSVFAKNEYSRYWAVKGTLVTRDSNSMQMPGIFLVDPALLNGAVSGKFLRFGGDQFIPFDCKAAQ